MTCRACGQEHDPRVRCDVAARVRDAQAPQPLVTPAALKELAREQIESANRTLANIQQKETKMDPVQVAVVESEIVKPEPKPKKPKGKKAERVARARAAAQAMWAKRRAAKA